MSNGTITFGAGPHTTYDRVQSALGQPAAETLQVDDSMSSLDNSAEFLVETVQALLRRIEPVTGDLSNGPLIGMISGTIIGAGSTNCITVQKVPMALQLDKQHERLCALTREVQQAIRALQI